MNHDITPTGLEHVGHLASIAVGLDPVSVRARTHSEAWVVSHISDSISIVDLTPGAMRVVRTLNVGDDPSDVVFVNTPRGQRAFVSLALPSRVKMHDTANLSAPPQTITIQGHRPKAMATERPCGEPAIPPSSSLPASPPCMVSPIEKLPSCAGMTPALAPAGEENAIGLASQSRPTWTPTKPGP